MKKKLVRGGNLLWVKQSIWLKLMTWTNTHTIPWVNNATVHDALVYFFDTYLGGKSMFTVSAHPDASAFKRSYEVTYNNAFTGTTAKKLLLG